MIQRHKQASLAHTLREVANQGDFEAVVLVGDEGLPLAIGSSTYSAETVAAMVTLVKGLVEQTQAELGLGTVDEVSIAAEGRVQLVCRYFSVAHEKLTLALIAPLDQSYRRLTSKAIKEIKAIL